MYKLYNMVKAKRKISNEVAKGTLGTILIIHDESFPKAYEVEFVNSDMESLGVLTVNEDDIILDGMDNESDVPN